MQNENFKCPITGEKFFITSFRCVLTHSDTIYKDKYGKQLINASNGSILVPIEKEGDIGAPMLAKYNHRSSEGLKNLKKNFGSRANKFDTKGAGKDERDTKQKDFKEALIHQMKSKKK